MLLSSGSSFGNPEKWSVADEGEGGWYVGDYNGDGKDDIARYVESGNFDDGFQVLLSNGSSLEAPEKWTSSTEGKGGWHVGDFDGDGKDDIARYMEEKNDDDGFQVLISNGNSFIAPAKWTDAGVGNQDWYIGDFNGDGKEDIFRYIDGKSSADMFLSNGSSFQPSGSWCNVGNDLENDCLGLTPDGKWYIGDFDGDGADDIFRYLAGLSGAEVFLSNQINEFVFNGNWSQAEYSEGWTIGDFNGDGHDDISSYDENTGAEVYLSCHEDIISSIYDEPINYNNNVIAYPNPFNNQIHFKINSKVGDKINIELFDINGRLVDKVYEGNSYSESMIISREIKKDFPTGVYFAKIIFDNRVSTLKLIHQLD